MWTLLDLGLGLIHSLSPGVGPGLDIACNLDLSRTPGYRVDHSSRCTQLPRDLHSKGGLA